MKKNVFILCSMIISGLIFFSACQDLSVEQQFTGTPNLPLEVADYESIQFPAHFSFGIGVDSLFDNGFFPNIINSGSQLNPPVTDHGATLGRVLFYDTQLSINNSVSCATCHDQSKAFADGITGSVGFAGKITPRNSMALVNPSMNNNLFWDSRVQSLPQLILEPIQNHIEMGMEDLNVLTKKLAATDYYPDLFAKAYGDKQVTKIRIADAVSQFLGAMKSVDSKFDKGVQNNFTNFTAMERLGFNIFHSEKNQCASCHNGSNFSAPDFPGGEYGGGGDSFTIDNEGNIIDFNGNGEGRAGTTNIGLDLVAKDEGRGNGNFRIPSLRNIGLTAPYMHDGRFTTLAEVVEHYNSGVQAHPNLDDKFKNQDGTIKRLNLTSVEKQALVAFLHTLTDESLITDERFSNPFTK